MIRNREDGIMEEGRGRVAHTHSCKLHMCMPAYTHRQHSPCLPCYHVDQEGQVVPTGEAHTNLMLPPAMEHLRPRMCAAHRQTVGTLGTCGTRWTICSSLSLGARRSLVARDTLT